MGLYLGKEKISNVAVGEAALGITDISDETTINLSGLIKGENGTIKVAEAGTDYLAPDALNNLGNLANKNKVSLSDLDTDVSQKLNSGLTIDDINTAINNSSIHTNTTYEPQNDRALADKHYVDKKSLPNTSSSDNGKVLGVSNGAWTITEPQAKIYAGSYTGDGTTSRDITLEFAPKVMFILIPLKNTISSSLPEEQKLYTLINGMTYALHSLPNGNNVNTISLLHNNFQIIGSSDSSAYKDGNQEGKVYNYVLLA